MWRLKTIPRLRMILISPTRIRRPGAVDLLLLPCVDRHLSCAGIEGQQIVLQRDAGYLLPGRRSEGARADDSESTAVVVLVEALHSFVDVPVQTDLELAHRLQLNPASPPSLLSSSLLRSPIIQLFPCVLRGFTKKPILGFQIQLL